MEHATKLQIAEALRGSQIGAIVACALGVEMPAPRFTSKAVITSDGFLQANFVGSDGRSHLSAFVGSYEELQDNLRSVQDYLRSEYQLGEDVLSELWDEVAYKWIATDYRS